MVAKWTDSPSLSTLKSMHSWATQAASVISAHWLGGERSMALDINDSGQAVENSEWPAIFHAFVLGRSVIERLGNIVSVG